MPSSRMVETNFTAEQGSNFYAYIGGTANAQLFDTQDYVGGIEYKNNTLEAIYHSEGRLYKNASTWQYEYTPLAPSLRLGVCIIRSVTEEGTCKIEKKAESRCYCLALN